MRQKTIIQVWGAHNIGKSETIKITHQELIKKYVNKAHKYSLPFPPPNHDIYNEFLTCDGKKVGIESMGDYLNMYGLNQRLDDYIKVHCVDILICASRVRNDVSRHIQLLATQNDYRIIKVAPYIVEEPQFVRNEVNKLAAEHVVSIVDSVIHGRI